MNSSQRQVLRFYPLKPCAESAALSSKGGSPAQDYASLCYREANCWSAATHWSAVWGPISRLHLDRYWERAIWLNLPWLIPTMSSVCQSCCTAPPQPRSSGIEGLHHTRPVFLPLNRDFERVLSRLSGCQLPTGSFESMMDWSLSRHHHESETWSNEKRRAVTDRVSHVQKKTLLEVISTFWI